MGGADLNSIDPAILDGIVNRLNALRPVLFRTVDMHRTIKNSPAIAAEIARLDNIYAQKYSDSKATDYPLLDMRHYLDGLEKRTGVPFGRVWDEMYVKRRSLDARLRDDPAMIEKITDWLNSGSRDATKLPSAIRDYAMDVRAGLDAAGDVGPRIYSKQETVGHLYERVLAEDAAGFRALVDTYRDLFARPEKVSAYEDANLDVMMHRPSAGGDLGKVLLAAQGQMATAVLINPEYVVQNLLQNPAYYTGLEDFFRARKLRGDDLAYFDTVVRQDDGILDTTMQKGNRLGDRLPGFRTLNKAADALNVQGRLDTINRYLSFSSKLNAVQEAVRRFPDYAHDPGQLNNMMRFAGMGDLTATQRKHFLEKLAVDGPEEAARFAARLVTDATHFAYVEPGRAPIVQGSDLAKLAGNLTTYPRSVGQRLSLDSQKVGTGADRAAGRGDPSLPSQGGTVRGLRSLVGMTVGASVVGAIYQQMTGKPTNIFDPVDSLSGNLQLGGFGLSAANTVGQFAQDLIGAVQGDQGALDRALKSVETIGDGFVPFYRGTVATVEALTDTVEIDTAAIQLLRSKLDSRYNPGTFGKYAVDRNTVEQVQHALFDTDPFYLTKQAMFPRQKVPTVADLTPEQRVALGLPAKTSEALAKLRRRRDKTPIRVRQPAALSPEAAGAQSQIVEDFIRENEAAAAEMIRKKKEEAGWVDNAASRGNPAGSNPPARRPGRFGWTQETCWPREAYVTRSTDAHFRNAKRINPALDSRRSFARRKLSGFVRQVVERMRGRTHKRWVTAGGDKMCPACATAGARGWVPIARNFPDAGRVPPAHMNCRCRIEYEKP